MEQINKITEPATLGSILGQVVSQVQQGSTTDLLNDGRPPSESARLRRVVELSGLPKVLKGKSLSNLTGYESQKAMAVEALKQGKSIFITGPCGTGKSHMAYGLIGAWWKEVEYLTPEEIERVRKTYSYDAMQATQRSVQFLPAVELFYELKQTFEDGSQTTESDIITKYVVKDLLVIDDIGAEKISEWSRQTFYLLVDRRYRDCKQTIYTSNLSLEQLKNVVDDRIASRLSTCELIELKGEDGKGSDWRVSHGE